VKSIAKRLFRCNRSEYGNYSRQSWQTS